MNPFTQRVIKIIQGIPEGHVMTYGQIAGLAGSPRGARQVVRILHSSSGKHGLPWHRVVNARGEIGIQQEDGRILQMLYLRGEGVEVADNGQLDLDRWRFIPSGE
ncbi:DNA methyltransferase [Paenibacillus sp. A3]|uniref:MGMT family protein n=1 Tax=Paenibacillus sp. A3 TaxID=1337054 RepID=UPI0006D577C6|nr:MGMT family protein [Paenibacillus sp. A3]KPV60450.1 DNA methyltransferase [Paenibacillus sp. A3]